jgi:hypothetical protein
MNKIFYIVILIILTNFVSFEFGSTYRFISMLENTQKCADDLFRQVEIDPDHMKKFYGHKKGEMGNVYSHADAITELEWARCFRKELRK